MNALNACATRATGTTAGTIYFWAEVQLVTTSASPPMRLQRKGLHHQRRGRLYQRKVMHDQLNLLRLQIAERAFRPPWQKTCAQTYTIP